MMAGAKPAMAHGPRHFSRPEVPDSLLPSWEKLSPLQQLLETPPGNPAHSMLHPGLPETAVVIVMLLCGAIFLWFLLYGLGEAQSAAKNPPLIPLSKRSRFVTGCLQLLFAFLFLLAIYGGLNGSGWPELNLATVLVWHWWWPLVIISAILLGSVWCTLCPWNNLAGWLVPNTIRHQIYAPRWLRSVYPALILFLAFTWLELGWGLAHDPQATAWLALLMLLLALLFVLRFEKRVFCHGSCPIGRTLGFYSRLAPIGVAPRKRTTCDSCTTLDCHYGNDQTPPCPTSLKVGKLQQNTFCTLCGNCVRSCPHDNVALRMRGPAAEAETEARPKRDEAIFMLVLLGVTLFHGFSMLPGFPYWQYRLSALLGETGEPLGSTLILLLAFQLPVFMLYAAGIFISQRLSREYGGNQPVFDRLAFATLPIAAGYHLAHNLTHLSRERASLINALGDPTGINREPMGVMEWHHQMLTPWMADNLLHLLQGGLMLGGFALSARILWRRGVAMTAPGEFPAGWRLAPILAILLCTTWLGLFLLSQNMVMRF